MSGEPTRVVEVSSSRELPAFARAATIEHLSWQIRSEENPITPAMEHLEAEGLVALRSLRIRLEAEEAPRLAKEPLATAFHALERLPNSVTLFEYLHLHSFTAMRFRREGKALFLWFDPRTGEEIALRLLLATRLPVALTLGVMRTCSAAEAMVVAAGKQTHELAAGNGLPVKWAGRVDPPDLDFAETIHRLA